MATKIDSVSARDRLKPRREPYWFRVSKGCYVGIRKMTTLTPGVWWARYRDVSTGKQVARALGDLEHLAPSARFDAALKLGREWFEHMGMGGKSVPTSVKAACDDYVKRIRSKKSGAAADDLEARYRRWVHGDPIAKIELTKLLPDHVQAFRQRLLDAPVKVGKDGDTRTRSKDSVNRDMTALRAALNNAKANRAVTTDFAWSEALKPIKKAGKPRELYLDRDQRRRFIDSAQPDMQHFLRGLSLLPLRPGALATLLAGDFERRLKVLKIGKDKHGQDRKIELPVETAAFFDGMAKGKLPAAPLIARADGKAWDKDAWKGPVKDAAAAAKLPEGTTAYTMRHSVITDLVHDGRLDLLTVAQLSGTSVAMIEKTYGHLRRGKVAGPALAGLAL